MTPPLRRLLSPVKSRDAACDFACLLLLECCHNAFKYGPASRCRLSHLLECQLGPQFHSSVAANRASNVAKICGIARVPTWLIEYRSVGYAECFCAKLQANALSYGKSLEQCRIHVEIARTGELVSAHVSRSLHRVDGAECRGVEPQLGGPNSAENVEGAHLIRSLTGSRCVESRSASAKVQWPAAHDGHNRAHLPAASDPVRPAGMQQGLALSERQLINHALHKSVPAAVAELHIVALEIYNKRRTAPVIPASIPHVRSVCQGFCERVGRS